MLYNYFFSNEHKPINKWSHYFSIYERHFGRYVNQPVNFWEIGVLWGGSLQMWKTYFGPFARIVGIDINPEFKKHEEHQIKVEIGNQADPVFLQNVIDKYGTPDVVLDDGSHMMDDIYTTFNFLYDKIAYNGVYMVEDLHTAYFNDFGGGLNRKGTFIEHCKDMIDSLNSRHYSREDHRNAFANSTYSMSFYDSIAVFEKTVWREDSLKSLIIPGINLRFINIYSGESLSLLGKSDEKYIVFCAGLYGYYASMELKKYHVTATHFVDNDKDKQGGKIDGIEIISPKESVAISGGKYIIATLNDDIIADVANQLKSLGVPKSSIYKSVI